jgi:hypothetical protein
MIDFIPDVKSSEEKTVIFLQLFFANYSLLWL